VSAAQDLNWLVTAFTERVPDVEHAAVVSADGFLLAYSDGLRGGQVAHLAAVTAGLASLVQGAAAVFQAGKVAQTVVAMDRALLVVMAVGDGAALVVLAAADCDMGLVAFEMALLAERAGRALTPQVRGTPPGGPGQW
jgi:hypothetical protein